MMGRLFLYIAMGTAFTVFGDLDWQYVLTLEVQ